MPRLLKRPTKRPDMPARRSDNDKRRLLSGPDTERIQELRQNIRYQGSSKHKQHPHLYDLEPFHGKRGDETLCDRDANFGTEQMATVPQMIDRSIQAGLLGENGMLWAVADNGWIYEARLTNAGQFEYHGYPVRASEAIARPVYERFTEWAQTHGDPSACRAATNCRQLYGFK